jgi:hypothetical protein
VRPYRFHSTFLWRFNYPRQLGKKQRIKKKKKKKKNDEDEKKEKEKKAIRK